MNLNIFEENNSLHLVRSIGLLRDKGRRIIMFQPSQISVYLKIILKNSVFYQKFSILVHVEFKFYLILRFRNLAEFSPYEVDLKMLLGSFASDCSCCCKTGLCSESKSTHVTLRRKVHRVSCNSSYRKSVTKST